MKYEDKIIKASWFKIADAKEKYPVIIYLHGNSSSRIEGLSLIEYLLPLGYSLFCFDFAGCGMSEGQYVSLG